MRLIPLFLFMFLYGATAHAETTPLVKLDNSQTKVTYGYDDTGHIRGALEIALDDGWDTYWRTPGDAGLPVSIDTTGSNNLKSAALLWPVPTRMVKYEMNTYIYSHKVIFPLAVEPENAAAPIRLKMKVKYAACKEICTFLDHIFEATINPDKKLSAEELAYVKDAESKLSTPLEKQTDISITSVILDHDAKHITIEARSLKGFEKPDILIEGGAIFRFPEPAVMLSENNKKAVLIAPSQVLISDKELEGQELTFTLVDGERAVEWKATPKSPGGGYTPARLLLMLLFAVIGGLILNVMPCVLPVLSLKVLGVLKKTGKERKIVRRSFLASSAGIITSFLMLAAIVVGLKAAGRTVGWGFQFQEPIFLVFLFVILILFAVNLFGIFEIKLPQFISDFALRKSDKSHGYGEHFLTGAFATLMATPCSAPFLGTAIGFAFSQGTIEVFALFFAMGVGLSIPYLMFAAFPSLVRLLPKPGAWMVTAKKFFGLLLVATALWIGWMLMMHVKSASQNPSPADIWQEFDLPKIDSAVASGKVVVVDVTADWCLTCKANKLLVLDTPAVMEILASPNVVAMKANWTNYNESITDYLKSFGRYGIPFNAVYGPNAPKGIALPELLSEDKIRKAIEKAGGKVADKERPEDLP